MRRAVSVISTWVRMLRKIIHGISVTIAKNFLKTPSRASEYSGQLAQLVRACGLHPQGQRFESSTAHFDSMGR